MKHSTDTELVERLHSKYVLTVAVYHRAQQINEGAKALIKTDTSNPVAIAIEEIRAGLVKVAPPPQVDLDPVE